MLTRTGLGRLAPLALILPAAGLLRLLHGPGNIGYDAAWALVWGRELLHGELPSYEAPGAPTPHPLANLVSAPLMLLGADGAIDAVLVISWLALAALAYAAFRLGEALFGRWVGVTFAILVASRPLLGLETAQAIVDIPFLALVVAATACEARRPRADPRVPWLLAAAGLLRPEGWLIALAWLAYAHLGRPLGRGAARDAAIVLAAPVLWALSDLVITGDPLHSLHGTQDLAAALDRPRDVDTAFGAAPVYLRFALGSPLVWIGFAGTAAGLLWRYERSVLPAALAGLGLLAFLALGIADLPLLIRYLLLPALMLLLFAAALMVGWIGLPGEAPERRWWMVAGVGALLVLAAYLPREVDRATATGDRGAARRAVQADLHAIADLPAVREARGACGRLWLPDPRPRALLALWLDRPPAALPDAPGPPDAEGLFLAYADDIAGITFSIVRPPPPSGPESLPPGAQQIAANRSWLLARRC